MVNFTKKEFVKFYLGDKKIRSHIDAVHACPPDADEFTGNIVGGVVNKINCSGIIAIVSRRKVDLNEPRNSNNEKAIDEYRQTIREILDHTNTLDENERLIKPYLHLAIHGIKNTVHGPLSIEIGTRSGETCSPEVKDWFIEKIEELKGCDWEIIIDRVKKGDSSKSVHRWGDQTSDLNYLGYGDNFNTFQIEISRMLRENHRNDLINMFSDIIIHFNEKFK